ncbi:MAG TPA: protein translocase subunit SecD, partial [Burkholderiaceae bacterium]|nr:protein translocase subunit SecD [Burkholderiaceae bacterium]
MNRYPLWKYAILLVALIVGTIYTLPNFFGEAPAVQVSSAKATLKVDAALVPRVQEAIKGAGIEADFVQLDGTSVRARFQTTDTQLKAKDAIDKALNADPADPGYIVALNLLSRSPAWLTALHALPMYLGLDLRGGVHFLLQVDMKGALTKRLDSVSADLRTLMRDKNLRHPGITREGERLVIRFRDAETRVKALIAASDAQSYL